MAGSDRTPLGGDPSTTGYFIFEVDGVEMMSNNMDSSMRERAAVFIGKHPNFATLGNSDAHEIDVVGHCRTRFAVPVRSMEDLIAAIRNRQATPVPNAR